MAKTKPQNKTIVVPGIVRTTEVKLVRRSTTCDVYTLDLETVHAAIRSYLRQCLPVPVVSKMHDNAELDVELLLCSAEGFFGEDLQCTGATVTIAQNGG